jgi:hypothetical protein
VTATRYILESEIIYKTTAVSFKKKEVERVFFLPSPFLLLLSSTFKRGKEEKTTY